MKYGIISVVLLAICWTGFSSAEELPLVDTHIHYSHDAWEMLPPEKAVGLLRKAGLKYAFVSSSSDDGTQMLYDAAPNLVIPVLRPYRKRGELSSWLYDESVPQMLERRLEKYKYAGIGEFHVFGDDTNLPVMRKVIQLAHDYGIFLHAHSDSKAVENIFKIQPQARVLWAHSGFEQPTEIRRMLSTYENLMADLAFRNEHAVNGEIDPQWQALFMEFPDRITVGTDTYTPERWFYVEDHANWSREWLMTLPDQVRENIAYRNAERLKDWGLSK
ncbi:amidohydrolase family protein [Sneathiella glossodoripedis]|uniref:amidohydrolase family protein n=1 Tax=Sneathiella glossodoripedis TaxID=418853 RepID=UPI0004714995|nr:amidohydrolase family protein [Sneathiella glossodoripedis]